jgi:WD40 repeat protein
MQRRRPQLSRRYLALWALMLGAMAMATQVKAKSPDKVEIVSPVGHSFPVNVVTYSSDGKLLLSGSSDGTIKLWAAATGQLVRTFQGRADYVSLLAFSPDGKRLVSGNGEKTFELWDGASGQRLRTFVGHTGSITALAFSTDGAYLLSGSDDNTINLWNSASGVLLRTFLGHSNSIKSVAFASNNLRILSGSRDTIKAWDTQSGNLYKTVEMNSQLVDAYAFSNDGNKAVAGGETLQLLDINSGRVIRSFGARSVEQDIVTSVAISPDGSRIVAGYRGLKDHVRLWDATSGVLLQDMKEQRYSYPYPGVRTVSFSPDGTHFISGGTDNAPKLWDTATGQLIRTFGDQSPVRSVAFSHDGTGLLSGGDQIAIQLWSATTGQLLRRFERSFRGSDAVAFFPDGKQAISGGGYSALQLWDSVSGKLLGSIDGKHDAFALSSDGSRLISISPCTEDGDGMICPSLTFWDFTNSKVIHRFSDPDRGHFYSVDISPDGKFALAGSSDKKIKLWDLATMPVPLVQAQSCFMKPDKELGHDHRDGCNAAG